ncbi:MAG: sensor domain-containing protein, partial [Rhizomicrobium sp.]
MHSDQALKSAPETVRAYLTQLRHALKGAPRGLIADALADCEEHLNNEIAQNPDMDEKAVLASVIETYGSPQEIADEYRGMEAALSTPFPKAEKPVDTPRPKGSFFGVIADPQSYGALLYMMMALITGIFYFTWSVIGIAITTGCAMLIFGIPFALLFIGSVRMISHVEGRLVEGLLGVRMPRRMPAALSRDESLWTRIKDALTDVRTWTSLFYLLAMLPLGILYFVLTIVGLSLSLGVTGAAIYSLATNESHIQFDLIPWVDHLLHTAPGLV